MHPTLFLSFVLPLGALSIPFSNGRGLLPRQTDMGPSDPSKNGTLKGNHNVSGYNRSASGWKYVNDIAQSEYYDRPTPNVSPMPYISSSIYVEVANLAVDFSNHVTFLSVFTDFSLGGPFTVSCSIALPGITPNNATSNTTIIGTLPDAPSIICDQSLNHMGVNFTRSSGSDALNIFFLHTVQYENATNATVRSAEITFPTAPLFSYQDFTEGNSTMANGTDITVATAKALSLLAQNRMLKITEQPAPAGWQGDLVPCANLTNTTLLPQSSGAVPSSDTPAI